MVKSGNDNRGRYVHGRNQKSLRSLKKKVPVAALNFPFFETKIPGLTIQE